MLRKRANSMRKPQQTSTPPPNGDIGISVQRQRITTNTLLIGLTCMGIPDSSDSSSLISPTSPLDINLFSTRFPKPSLHSNKKCWVCSKVGLCSIVDSHYCNNSDHLTHDDNTVVDGKSSILLGSQVRTETNGIVCGAPQTLPKHCDLKKGTSDVLFEIGKIPSCSLDSKSLKSEVCRLVGGISASDVRPDSRFSKPSMGETVDASEIEESEDYTCVISHGPNPKTTHIFGDCVLGCHPCKYATTSSLEILPSTLPSDFLSYCNLCKKKLEEGKDIYMYRGEKAFCSWDCRSEGISMEEQKEYSTRKSVREETKDKSFEKSIFVGI